MSTKNGSVKLYLTSVLYKGKVTKMPISLVYEVKGRKPIHVDITSFRPDPSTLLEPDKKYQATLDFDSMWFSCDPECSNVLILRTVKIAKKNLKFVNTR